MIEVFHIMFNFYCIKTSSSNTTSLQISTLFIIFFKSLLPFLVSLYLSTKHLMLCAFNFLLFSLKINMRTSQPTIHRWDTMGFCLAFTLSTFVLVSRLLCNNETQVPNISYNCYDFFPPNIIQVCMFQYTLCTFHLNVQFFLSTIPFYMALKIVLQFHMF